MKILICDTDSIALIRGKWYDVLIIKGDTLFVMNEDEEIEAVYPYEIGEYWHEREDLT